MKRYKADVVVKYFFPVAAGIETNVLETYSRLTKKGWDITIHTTRDNHKKKSVLQENAKIKGLKVIRYESGIMQYNPKIDWENTDFVCLHNYDIFPHLWIYLRVLRDKLFRNKTYLLFITPHGGFNPDWKLFGFTKTLLKASYHFTLGTIIMNYIADGVRAVSEWEKVRMKAWGVRKNQVKVISNGLEDEAYLDSTKKVNKKFIKLANNNKPYIIQIGRLNPIKNFETAIKALNELPEKYKFIIIGPVQDKEYKQKLDSLVEYLELKDRIIFAGVVRGYDKYYLIKNSEALVHMALWEANCNVVHEGMSQKKVCFTSNRAGLRYQIYDNKNGFSFDAHDYKNLANKLNIYFKNKDKKKYTKLIEANLKYVKDHSWEKVSDRMGSFYINTLIN